MLVKHLCPLCPSALAGAHLQWQGGVPAACEGEGRGFGCKANRLDERSTSAKRRFVTKSPCLSHLKEISLLIWGANCVYSGIYGVAMKIFLSPAEKKNPKKHGLRDHNNTLAEVKKEKWGNLVAECGISDAIRSHIKHHHKSHLQTHKHTHTHVHFTKTSGTTFYLQFCSCLRIFIPLDCEQTTRRQKPTRLQRRCVEMQTLVRSARRNFRMKRRELPTPTPRRERRRQAVPIFQSNPTGEDGDLFVPLYYRPVSELFLSQSLSSFPQTFWELFFFHVFIPSH